VQTVILAAGKGVRLEAVNADLPKSLVPIAEGKPYLWYTLTEVDRLTRGRKIIVTGHLSNKMGAFLNRFGFVDYDVVFNACYEWGNLYSLLCVRSEIQDTFLLFNADHHYATETYEKMFSHVSDEITVFCDHDRILTDDDMKVDAHEGLLVTMDKKLICYQLGYVGVTYVPHGRLSQYWAACDATGTRLGEKANVEAVLNELVTRGEKIAICDISGSWWTEIDTPEDWEKARRVIFVNRGS